VGGRWGEVWHGRCGWRRQVEVEASLARTGGWEEVLGPSEGQLRNAGGGGGGAEEEVEAGRRGGGEEEERRRRCAAAVSGGGVVEGGFLYSRVASIEMTHHKFLGKLGSLLKYFIYIFPIFFGVGGRT